LKARMKKFQSLKTWRLFTWVSHAMAAQSFLWLESGISVPNVLILTSARNVRQLWNILTILLKSRSLDLGGSIPILETSRGQGESVNGRDPSIPNTRRFEDNGDLARSLVEPQKITRFLLLPLSISNLKICSPSMRRTTK